MPRKAPALLFAAPVFVALSSAGVSACAPGAKCLTAPEGTTPSYAVGDMLPRGQYQVLLNSEYYGLPPVPAGSWYYRVDNRVMRVRPDTLEVLEDVTDKANRAF